MRNRVTAGTGQSNQASGTGGERERVTRRHDRQIVDVPAHLEWRDRRLTGRVRDLSPGGALVLSNGPLTPGAALALRCSFGEVCYLNLAGQVVYCRDLDDGRSALGIRFAALREWEEQVLVSAIGELVRNAPTQGASLLSIQVAPDALSSEADRLTAPAPPARRPRRSSIHASQIVGWGAYLPSFEVSNQDISERVASPGYKNVGEVIEALTGIKGRRYATEERYPSDLAVMAAREALQQAGMDPRDLDTIIFFGISRDFHEPATANVVQEKLGATNAYVYDLANACNGFITAVDTLDSMIAAGRCENGLVVTGELISPYIDWNPKTKQDFKLSIFGYTIGDAGGAAVLSRAAAGSGRGILARWFWSAGEYWRLALAGELAGANPNDKYFKSNGRLMEEVSYTYMPMGFREIMRLLGWRMEDVDLVVPHQIPVSILENTYHKAVGIPLEKLVWTFPRYGNLATASMPVAMCDALKTNRAKPGDKVLLAGGAAGFSAGYIGLIL